MIKFPKPIGFAVAALLSSVLFYSEAFCADPAAASTPAAVQAFSGAVALQNREVYDLAADAWDDFLKQHPSDPLVAKAQHYRGVCLFKQKKYGEAIADFQYVIKNFPKVDLLESTYVNLGLAFYNQSQQAKGDASAQLLDKTLETLNTQLQKYPKGEFAPLARYYVAEAYYGRENLPKAVLFYKEYVQKHPKGALLADATYGLGVAEAESGDAKAAAATFTGFLAKHTNSPLVSEVEMRLGDAFLSLGNSAGAEPHFAKAAAANNFNHADYALSRQAACKFDAKEYEASASLYTKLLEAYPKSTYAKLATLNAGKAFLRAGKKEAAINSLKKAVQAGGASAPDAAHWLAKTLLEANNPKEALKVAEAAIAGATTNELKAALALDRADALYAIPERRKESLAAYQEVAKAHATLPEGAEALYLAADTALTLGNHKLAAALAQQYIKAFPKRTAATRVRQIAAEAALQQKKYPEAIAGFRSLLAEYPNDSEVSSWKNRLGLSLSLSGKDSETVELLQKQIPNMKDSVARAEAELLVGTALLRSKKVAEAVSMLQAASERAKSAKAMSVLDRALLQLATAQHQSKQLDAAIGTLKQLSSDCPKSRLLPQAKLRLANYLSEKGSDVEALEIFQALSKTADKSSVLPSAMLGAAKLLTKQNKPADAIKILDTFLENYAEGEQTEEAHFARAVARHKTNDFVGAISDLNAYIKQNPESGNLGDALYLRGLCQAANKQYEPAIASFQAVLSQKEKYKAADMVLYEMAWAMNDSKQAEQAMLTFTKLAKEYPKSTLAAECLYRVGESHYSKQKYAKAAPFYKEAKEKAGNTKLGEKSAHKLAWTLYQQKNYVESAKEFAAQRIAFPEGSLNADSAVMEGESQFEQKKYAEALAAYQASQKSKTTNDTFRVVSLLHGGQAAAQLEKWQESFDMLQKAANDFPKTEYKKEIDYERAWAMHNLGKTVEAKPIFEQVANNHTGLLGARSKFMVGEILMGEKKYSEAVRAFFLVAYGNGYPNSPKEFHSWQSNAMFDAARCLEQLKKKQAALKLYRELAKQFPKSEKAPHAAKRIEAISQ